MDVGVWMSPAVLQHKLDMRDTLNPEAVWNVRWVPEGLGQPQQRDRLFVAAQAAWRGYFLLSPDLLWNPNDPAAPYSLIFDTRTWTPIVPLLTSRFRGLRLVTAHELDRVSIQAQAASDTPTSTKGRKETDSRI